MRSLWKLSLDEYLEICELAKENGIKPGASMEPYFMAYMKFKNKKPSGHTELTNEELIKEFVSHGKKILNIDKKAYTFIKPKENKNENN